MDTRKVHWWESEFDATFIQGNNWNFNIAKSVIDVHGKTTSNIIWQSTGLAPMVNIEWKVDYALNWTAVLPNTGMSVSIGGHWQSCAPGDSYDLDGKGFWQLSSAPGQAGWLNVGNIGYTYKGVPGIHILVGVKNASTGNYDPIYVDPTSLPKNSSAAYQPQENVKWWLGSKTESGSVYSKTQGAVDHKNFAQPAPSTGNYEWWTTYSSTTGTWIDTATAPPQQLMVAPSRVAELLPLIRTAVFDIPIEVGLENATTAYLMVYLGQWYVSVQMDWADPRTLIIKLGPTHPTGDVKDLLSQYLATGQEDVRIQTGLHNAQAAHDLPPDAKWELKPGNSAVAVEEADDQGEMPQQQLDFADQRTKKLAAINNPMGYMNGVSPVNLNGQRGVSGGLQQIKAF